MHIKELAEQAGVTVKAVRYDETRGLIAPRRATNGYRTYDDRDRIADIESPDRRALRCA